jgi:hypothetical protein
MPENIVLNDVWTFSFEKMGFSTTLLDISGATCTNHKCRGDLPAPRRGHITFCHERYLYTFGGQAVERSEDTSKIY